jgi:predicted 2-oxoglutarate/Fe(II)-dependent dioxygenase YbiX
MIIKKLYDKIFYYEDILDSPEEFVISIEKSENLLRPDSTISRWGEWNASTDSMTTYGIGKSGVFESGQMVDENDFEAYKISSKIYSLSEFAISSYCNINMIAKPWLPNFFNIKKYSPGADMGPHIDSNDPTNIKHPVISGVMYLNDNYDGGEIDFPNQKLSIKPKAGSIIIFPSTDPYVHHPKKINSGNKYMVPLFWYKEPF